MFSRKNDLKELKAELSTVNDEIAGHPFKSKETAAANELIQAGKKENKTPAEINSELTAKNLPTFEDVGKATLNGLFGWNKLHRQRKKLEKKIRRLQP